MSTNYPLLMIAGGGYADIPLIHAAKSLGYRVITSGNRPEDMGHRESDLYCPGDFSDPDEMLRIAKAQRIDAVCACCNDFSAISAAYVAEKLGLPGHDSYETALTLHHKDRYRSFAERSGIPTPRACGFVDPDEAAVAMEKLRFPLIVKPVDLTGGKGINRVDSRAEYMSAVKQAFDRSKSKRIVVEEFITGTRHGFSAFISQGRVAFHFCDNEHYHLSPYLVSAASTPSIVPDRAVEELIRQSERICELLALKDGIFHVQFILHDDEPTIIEICRRPPGDLYIKLVQHATGVNYPEWIVRAAAGLPCPDLRQEDIKGCFVRHCVMGHSAGRLRDLRIAPEVEERIFDGLHWWRTGDLVLDPSIHKHGIVFLKYDDVEQMRREVDSLQNAIFADVAPFSDQIA